MKIDSPENYGRYPAHADIIPAGSEGRDAYGHRYGSQSLILTSDMLEALKGGDQLAVEINAGEYVLFIEAVPEMVTKAAIAELPEMERDPEKYKRYESFKALQNEITESWCADTNLAMAVKQIAKDEGISQEEALAKFKKTRVYNALYDFGTGMWGEGPASLIYLYNKYKTDDLNTPS